MFSQRNNPYCELISKLFNKYKIFFKFKTDHNQTFSNYI
jgi:hypothetical protein